MPSNFFFTASIAPLPRELQNKNLCQIPSKDVWLWQNFEMLETRKVRLDKNPLCCILTYRKPSDYICLTFNSGPSKGSNSGICNSSIRSSRKFNMGHGIDGPLTSMTYQLKMVPFQHYLNLRKAMPILMLLKMVDLQTQGFNMVQYSKIFRFG